jgi:hypothetical protein
LDFLWGGPKIADSFHFSQHFLSSVQEKMGGEISKPVTSSSPRCPTCGPSSSLHVSATGLARSLTQAKKWTVFVEEAEKIGEEKTKNFVNLCVANIQRSQSLAQQDFLTCRLRMNFMGWWLQHGELEAPASEVAKLFNSWKSMADYTFKFAKDDREQDTVLFFASDVEVSNAYSGKQLYRTQNEDENTLMLCG